MNYRSLGNTGLRVSELCFGTMTFGGDGMYKAIGSTEQAEADRLVGACLDAGINFFDTADVYSAGRSEQILGKALGARRKEVVVATKTRGRVGTGVNDVGLSRGHIMDSIDASLQRLGTDYIDLYQVHGFDTGGAAHGSLTVSQQGAGVTPSIIITNSYTGNTPASGTHGPAMVVGGSITNEGGIVNLSSAHGSLFEVVVGNEPAIQAQEVTLNFPDGLVLINQPGQTVFAPSDPKAEWDDVMIWPGGNPATTIINDPNGGTARLAAAFAANAIYNPNGTITDMSTYLIGHSNGGSAADGAFASIVFFGSCMPYTGISDCTSGTAAAQSPAGTAYNGITGSGGDHAFGTVPFEQVSYGFAQSSAHITTPVACQGQSICGAQVAILAGALDVDGDITVGQPSSWSVSLPSTLKVNGLTLAQYRQLYLNGGAAPTVDLPVSVLHVGDSVIHATFNAQLNQIVLNKVSAASSGGGISIDAGMFATNNVGRIHVNGGLGTVTVDNQTGTAIVIQDIYAGTVAVAGTVESTVDIIDRFQPVATGHSLYVYHPGATATTGTISRYQGSNNVDAATLRLGSATAINAPSTSYAPLGGRATCGPRRPRSSATCSPRRTTPTCSATGTGTSRPARSTTRGPRASAAFSPTRPTPSRSARRSARRSSAS